MEQQRLLSLKKKKGQTGLETILIGFVLIATVLVLSVLLIYTFGTVHTGLEDTAVSNSVVNESGAYVNTTGYAVDGVSSAGEPRTFVATAVWVNVSGKGYLLPSTNYTLSSVGILTNATIPVNATQYNDANVSYTYYNNSDSQTATRAAQTNVSRAIPLVGILFIILAIGALISILTISLIGRRRS